MVTLTLADRITDARSTMSIRGTAQQSSGDSGILKIKGTSVKELFPNKFSSHNDSGNNSSGGNVGKELFAEKVTGGGRRRQKAEDLFY